MFGSLGFPEIVMIGIVALLVFGPKKLPEVAKNLGKFIRELKLTVEDAKEKIQEEFDEVTKDIDIKEITDNYKDIKKEFKVEEKKKS